VYYISLFVKGVERYDLNVLRTPLDTISGIIAEAVSPELNQRVGYPVLFSFVQWSISVFCNAGILFL